MKAWLRSTLASAGHYLSSDTAYRKDLGKIASEVASVKRDNAWQSTLASAQLQLMLAEEESRLRAAIATRTPENLVLQGWKAFSQADEDGIINAIFDKLGGRKTFLEIACGNGIENNTHLLLLNGWKGVWVDGSDAHIADIQAALGGLSFPRLLVEKQFVDLKNIDTLLEHYCSFLGRDEVDFFSLDIDGNDLHVLVRGLEHFSPRVICVEYNAKFPPPTDLAIQYNSSHIWSGDDYQGASLMSLVEATKSRYTLLTCSMSGVNAFLVRNDLAQQFRIYALAELYQPARYYRIHTTSGHPPSLKWLRNVLARQVVNGSGIHGSGC